MKKDINILVLLLSIIIFSACQNNDDEVTTTDNNCEAPSIALDATRGACDQTLSFTPSFTMNVMGANRVIMTNNIPAHMVGLFGMGMNALNPNPITEQNTTYRIPVNPTEASTKTFLLSNTTGPTYAFGVALNGVKLDPVAAEPFPNSNLGTMDPNVNWEWNLEALNVNLGLDCSNAHVQPTGEYHYHGPPNGYFDDLTITGTAMVLVGYAADGFPIYYKYGYSSASDNSSSIKELTSSYQLKTGTRPGDGVTAPCGDYNGIYSNDYEYVSGLGDLDECNGRTGVTPEFPGGTYYYVITDDFPAIPRCLVGTPSNDFKLGG